MQTEMELERIDGHVVAVIYFSEETGYTVLRAELDDGSQAIIVGCIPMAAPGESITAWGQWTRQPSHG